MSLLLHVLSDMLQNSRRLGIYETKGIPIKAKEKDEQRLRTKRVNNPTLPRKAARLLKGWLS
jgi:hypothetical protein